MNGAINNTEPEGEIPDRISEISSLPNLLSLSRVIIAPIIFFAIKADNLIVVAILAAWALLSDFLDGLLARRLNLISDVGKILDPLADKLCVAAAAIAATIYGDFPVLLLVIIMVRDLAIASLGLALSREIKAVPVSNRIGKVTVTVLAAALIVYVYRIYILYPIAFWFTIAFITLSSISYLFAGLHLMSKKGIE